MVKHDQGAAAGLIAGLVALVLLALACGGCVWWNVYANPG